MLPAATLIADRNNEILQLERELKVLEGDTGDEEDANESNPLDSSQTLSLSASMTKQMADGALTLNMNEINEIK